MHKQYHRVARVGEIEPGQGRVVTLGGEECVLYLTEEGTYHASTPLCPHMNEPLDRARLEGCEVVCRRHHLRFDLRTGDCTNAGGYWLKTFDVRVDGQDVLVGRWED